MTKILSLSKYKIYARPRHRKLYLYTEKFVSMGLLGIIPARGGSKRLRGKNVRKLDGEPLISYTIKAALKTDVFDKLIVSTEDDEIADIAREYGAKVPFMRPEELARDEAQLKDVTQHIINKYKKQGVMFDEVMVLPPTSPLRNSSDIENAYSKFTSNESNYLISITNYQFPPVRAFQKSENDFIESYWVKESYVSENNKESLFKRSQDYPEFYADCASIYLMDVDSFTSNHTFHGDDCLGYYIPPERAIDIDERFNFKIAELLVKNKKKNKETGYDLLDKGY